MNALSWSDLGLDEVVAHVEGRAKREFANRIQLYLMQLSQRVDSPDGLIALNEVSRFIDGECGK